MMLVISVIVALAILAVLMNIIGGIDLGGTSNPETAIRDGLREVQSKGYGLTAPKKINLKKDTEILGQSVIGTTPIAKSELAFYCSGSTICGTGTSSTPAKSIAIANTLPTDNLKVGKDSVPITSNVEATMVVCSNEERAVTTEIPQRYCVVLARTSAEATATCKKQCGIT